MGLYIGVYKYIYICMYTYKSAYIFLLIHINMYIDIELYRGDICRIKWKSEWSMEATMGL